MGFLGSLEVLGDPWGSMGVLRGALGCLGNYDHDNGAPNFRRLGRANALMAYLCEIHYLCEIRIYIMAYKGVG